MALITNCWHNYSKDRLYTKEVPEINTEKHEQ